MMNYRKTYYHYIYNGYLHLYFFFRGVDMLQTHRRIELEKVNLRFLVYYSPLPLELLLDWQTNVHSILWEKKVSRLGKSKNKIYIYWKYLFINWIIMFALKTIYTEIWLGFGQWNLRWRVRSTHRQIYSIYY